MFRPDKLIAVIQITKRKQKQRKKKLKSFLETNIGHEKHVTTVNNNKNNKEPIKLSKNFVNND